MNYNELDWEALRKSMKKSIDEYMLCDDCGWVGSIVDTEENINSPYICPECKCEYIYPIEW